MGSSNGPVQDRGGGDYGGARGRGKTPPDINHLHSIMVFNISYKTRKEELYRSFDSFGDIADVYIPRDKYGESRGFGFVRFYDRRDAEDAKSMDGQLIGGRRIGVQMAKYGRRHEQGGFNRDRGGGYGRDRAPHGGHGRRRSYSRSRSRSIKDNRRRSFSHSRSRSPSHDRHRKGSDPVTTNVATTTTTMKGVVPKVEAFSGAPASAAAPAMKVVQQIAAPPPVQPVVPVTTQV